ncbi:glutathione S-transferase N-terminal domain-containing protein [Oscillatoria sp. FACHB-1407]|uniref:Tom37 metaxin N-terminal-like domain-containing protein n=1 Tax=Oscillatoria sp. FACHB-1407 TaxID=2692847 RepID=UPI001683B678|nr:Tom37 metaxin N-terminal-like domain-containing protein [Oscillatoria sp. FACHB-1407]MBD2460286.1 glutathione S-transferase N-terminal domain-containing protein [Oscillatoria sp. FACHB-1407]
MLTLYTTPSLWGLPSISPACMKLETWLRMAQIPYQRNQDLDLSLAPKGKIPFIEDRGEFIGDSTLIVQRLQQRTGIDLDRTLTPEQQAIALAFRRMLKEHTYWGLVQIRYA